MVGSEADDGRHDDDGRQLPERLLRDLLSDPKAAAESIALPAVRAWGADARDFAARVRAEHPEATRRDLAEMVKARYATLARMGGAGAALLPSLGATNTPATVAPSALRALWIQSRMVLHIAAVYGRDTTKPDMAAELITLLSPYLATEPLRVGASKGAIRYAKRVVNAHLKGDALRKAKAQFRRGHVNFSRAGVLRALPYLAIPVSAAVNEVATRSLANRAIKFYELAPRPAS